jgi:hypothetical protein
LKAVQQHFAAGATDSLRLAVFMEHEYRQRTLPQVSAHAEKALEALCTT